MLAEDFFAPTYTRMRQAYLSGDAAGARKEQRWKYAAIAAYSKYGGTTAERAMYRAFPDTKRPDGADVLGPGRWPFDDAPLDAARFKAMCAELAALDFWPEGSAAC